MWVHNGIYYRIKKCVIDYDSNQMAIDYIGYANSNLNQPVSMKTYITSIKPFKDETELENIVHNNQSNLENLLP